MNISTILKAIENALHEVVDDVDTVIEPGIAYLKANVPAAAITLGEGVLSAMAAGTPWAALMAALITQAEAAGIKLAENAASAALNAAQNNLIAKGDTSSVLTPAAAN